MFGLDYLISPYEKDKFLSDQFGKKAILIPGAENKFENLFTWDDINHLVEFGQTVNSSARLVYEKNDLGPNQFPRQSHWINEGATYVINHLQTKDPVIDRYARTLSAELNTSVNINTYISAKSKQAFDTHFDKHDVFILQVYGSKKWAVFNPTIKHPLEYMEKKEEPPESDPYIECTLSPGDVLYIPRGHWHYALASESTVHLTVGLDARCPVDFLSWLIKQELLSDENMRESFPLADSAMFLGSRNADELDDFAEKFKSRMLEQLNGDRFKELFTEFVMGMNRMAIAPKVKLPEQFLLKDNITLDTQFELPVGQKVILKHDNDKNIGIIYSRGVTVRLEGVSNQALSAVFHIDPNNINGRSIQDKCPDMKDESIKVLLLNLVEEGVIQLKREA